MMFRRSASLSASSHSVADEVTTSLTDPKRSHVWLVIGEVTHWFDGLGLRICGEFSCPVQLSVYNVLRDSFLLCIHHGNHCCTVAFVAI